MSRHTENKEEILKIHGCIDLINQRIDTIENNHLSPIAVITQLILSMLF